MNKSSSNIAAIVLAAGMSRRMGRLKPLLSFGNKPMLARVIESLQSCNVIDSIVVVTGHAASQIESAIIQYSVQFAYNEYYETGEMLSSVQCGVRALPPHTEAFFLALGDQPAVQSNTIRGLLRAWQSTRAPIVLPTHNGSRGHPVLFDASCAAEILRLGADATLKNVVQAHREHTVAVSVDDAGTLLDVDTPQEYERALKFWRHEQHDKPELSN